MIYKVKVCKGTGSCQDRLESNCTSPKSTVPTGIHLVPSSRCRPAHSNQIGIYYFKKNSSSLSVKVSLSLLPFAIYSTVLLVSCDSRNRNKKKKPYPRLTLNVKVSRSHASILSSRRKLTTASPSTCCCIADSQSSEIST